MINLTDRQPNLAARIAIGMGLTIQQLEELMIAASRTWDGIGFDCLQALGIPSTSGKTISRSVVIELVCDASHIESNNPRLSPEVVAALRNYDPKVYKLRMLALKTFAFPYTRYGY